MARYRIVSTSSTGLLVIAMGYHAAAAPPQGEQSPTHTERAAPHSERAASKRAEQSASKRAEQSASKRAEQSATHNEKGAANNERAAPRTEQSATHTDRAAPHSEQSAPNTERTAPDRSKAVTAPEQTKRAASSDRVTSQVLFERGRELFVAGNYAEACPLFEESHRLSPGIGVLLHLGACLEKAGKPAAAWAAFEEAADRAKGERDAKREAVARARASALRGKLAYLTLRVRDAKGALLDAAAASHVELAILHNDAPVPNAAMGVEIPVDPGEHRIVVQAKGRAAAEKRVTLGSTERGAVEVELGAASEQAQHGSGASALTATPSLAATNGTANDGRTPRPADGSSSKTGTTIAGAVSTGTKNAVPAPSSGEPRDANASTPSGPRDWNARSPKVTSGANPYALWSAIGVGGVGLITGGVAGLVAYTKMQEARALCEGHPSDDCPERATARQDEARFPARVSTIAVSVGAASLAFAGGYWLLSRRHQAVVTGSVQPGIALISVRSRW